MHGSSEAGLPRFLSALVESGRVSVAAPGPISEQEQTEAGSLLAAQEAVWRRRMPLAPPPFSPASALWAAVVLYRACQLAVFRDVDAEQVRAEFDLPFPEPVTPASHYSADLSLRFLPELHKLVKATADGDPLLDHLAALGAAWPLSSVGMPSVRPGAIDMVVEEPSLLALYVDRILRHGDLPRLEDGRVRDAARRAIGLFPELAPRAAEALDRLDAKEVTSP